MQVLKWLWTHEKVISCDHLQIHKFLFFYSVFIHLKNEDADWKYLSAYQHGPVFSNLYGDYLYRNQLLREMVEKESIDNLNIKIANKVLFLILTHTNQELSMLTHHLDLWRKYEYLLSINKKHIRIKIDDLSNNDQLFLDQIYNSCKDIDDYLVLKIQNKRFVIRQEDISRVDSTVYQTLTDINNKEDLMNPVYIQWNKNGEMIVD
ncbi:hypothetical protein [Ureaplasma sp. ES3154-GEN]|uniref:hypothetical protein n=1 Tax=Ureaplasma sp. ES3154-GEN TaxID=2984844 RepID=UPI0021E75902|nr:hypothetical protein [Ureaplasma sp. ES3154-GEN]